MSHAYWRVVVRDEAWSQIDAAPWIPQLEANRWLNTKLPRSPYPQGRAYRKGTKLHGKVDPIRGAQRRNRKVQHVRLGEHPSLWRLNYVVLPRHHAVFVYECVQHLRGQVPELYSKAHTRRILAAARRVFPNPLVRRGRP